MNIESSQPEARPSAAAPVVHLPVLVQSNKADELREAILAERGSTSEPAQFSSQPATRDAPPGSIPADLPEPIRRKLLEGKVIDALRQIYDPEIPVSIYELGLIYEIDISPDNAVKVKMTLTAPACPVAGTLPGEVERRIENIPEVKSADVELVWDPPWSRDRMSEAALLELGF